MESVKVEKNAILSEKIGTMFSVLVEKTVDGFGFGHSEEFLEVKFPCNNISVGQIINVKATEHNGNIIIGAIV